MRVKVRKWAPLALLLLCCAAFGLCRLLGGADADRQPPQIVLDSDEITLSVHDAQDALLRGVTAQDAHDGDVTASLVVESVRGVVDSGRFTATYAAFDSAGNVSKARRTVRYDDYTAPRFSLDEPLIFRSGSTPNVFSPLHASDVFDGDITGRIKGTLLSGTQQLGEPGDYVVEFRVSSSLGDTAYLAAPVQVLSGWGSGAQLALTDYLVYLPCGAAFDPEGYVSGLSYGMQSAQPGDEGFTLTVASAVDTSVPGVYPVDFTASCGALSGRTRLLVVVEEQA